MLAPSFPPPKRMLRLGVVGGGFGQIGRIHVHGARLSGRWELVAGALSSDPKRAEQAGRDWLLSDDRSYSDYCEMAQKESKRTDSIDAVAITTPNHLHVPVAKTFLESGIPVFCEKPLAPTVAEALELQDYQQKTGLPFAVAYVYSAHAMLRQARALVADGALGELRQAHVEYFQGWALGEEDGSDSRSWKLDPMFKNPSFTTADIGTHAIHLLSFVTGRRLTGLRAEFHVTGAPKPLEDTAFFHLRLDKILPATLMLSQAFAGSHCDLRLRVAGTKASLDWNAEQPEYLFFRPQDKPVQRLSRGYGEGMAPEVERLVRMPRGHPEALSDAWANLYIEFALAVEAWREGKALPESQTGVPTITDGVEGLRFVEAAIRSNRSQTWVDL